jgi:hypothetical protein
MRTIFFFLAALLLFSQAVRAQSALTFRQSVKGHVTDAESQRPLAGVSIRLMPGDIQAVTDSAGFYHLHAIPTGRYVFQYTIVGYEVQTLPDVIVSSGKELEQNVLLREGFKSLKAITVQAGRSGRKPLNEFAVVSARSFSMEETKRFPATLSDPARMVMNFPGVAAANDGSNELVVRGNSPQGVLWKLEGIEIPTPNHFSSLGATGGPISMLSSNVIGRSDFYTGAFPADIGNATAAAFELNFRNGNKNRPEYAVMLGALGAELSAEGPLGKHKNVSYLVNYRYSTLALLKPFTGIKQAPDYQDLSFKINWNTKKAGEFALFGIGGYNKYTNDPEKDSTKWDSEDEPNEKVKAIGKMGVIGLSHQVFVHSDAYIKTVVSASYRGSAIDVDTLNPAMHYNPVEASHQSFTDKALRISTFYNNKLDVRNTIRTGIIAQQWQYDFYNRYYDDVEKQWKQVLQGEGSTQFYQGYFQWKHRITNRLLLNTGVHASYLALTKKHSIEPRAALSYNAYGNVFSLAAGMHSKPEHTSTYLFENTAQGTAGTQPNRNLDLSKAIHFVAGYERFFSTLNLTAKAELYYQHLYHIPVEENSTSGFSTVNMIDVYDLVDKNPLVSKGKGKNYGIDLSLERPFNNHYFFMTNLSLFQSKYTDAAGATYHSRYDRNYMLNLLGGKEWQSASNPNKTVGINAKLLTSGGLRTSPLDLEASRATGKEQYLAGQYFTQHGPAYFRFDVSAYIRKDRKRSTHTLSLEIQNITNRENFQSYYFDKRTGQQKTRHQLGIFPNLSYKIQFHR